MSIIKILSGIAFLFSIAWFISQQDYEPAIAAVTSLSAFIAAWFGEKKKNLKVSQGRTLTQKQVGGNNSKNIQVGGNLTIGGHKDDK